MEVQSVPAGGKAVVADEDRVWSLDADGVRGMLVHYTNHRGKGGRSVKACEFCAPGSEALVEVLTEVEREVPVVPGGGADETEAAPPTPIDWPWRTGPEGGNPADSERVVDGKS